MKLWQIDAMGGGWLADGVELKVVTGLDDLVVVVRSDMPHEVAHLLTSFMMEAREILEMRLRHIPSTRSS